ncbi:Hypothetical predicted protein [Paramuricea clavata]|uniref:Uncharacterized protein n=1 Tax=Paramuricea clavata TaxID=317549 RepID=A0A6S7I721_PARCT|nr:Hypothetical predicted protein [Paramuricea clavata]
MGPVMGPVKLRYWDGFYVVFENELMNEPFENGKYLVIEEMLREDDGLCSLLEMVRKIAACTNVLLSPQFVVLSRKARFSHRRTEFQETLPV